MSAFKNNVFVLTAVMLIAGFSSFAQPEIDVADFEAFADGVFHTMMAENKLAGVTFSVVHKHERIIQKGYGYAQVDEGIAVDPGSSLFRIGSISKLFIWIAVMQMVEQGKLELDRDVNDYLTAFKIPQTYEQSVTLRSLMTHTPGFEDKLYRLFVQEPDEMLPLEEVLANEIPKRVRPPMQQASYSNHGTGIAQYLVELVSGVPFIEYSEQHIFGPLGMNHTTLRQPLPDTLANLMSKGYVHTQGRYIEKPFEFVPLQSVGGVSTTAADMALFMQALLNYGCHGGHCLLDSVSFAQMVAPAFYHADGVNPATLGFMDMSRNGYRAYGHGGNTFWFHSRMTLIPEANLGYFYSFNSENGAAPSGKVSELFFDYLLPDDRPLMPVIELDEAYLSAFAGNWRFNRFPHSEFFKILAWMNGSNISVHEGKLRFDAMGEITYWLPIDSLRFRAEDRNEILAFARDENGRISELFLGRSAIMALHKNTGLWNTRMHTALAILLVLVMAYISVVWPWMFFVRRRYARIAGRGASLPLVAKWIAWLTAACYVLFIVLIAFGSPAGPELVFGVTSAIKIALFFPILAIPLSLLMLWQSIKLLGMRDVKLFSRLFYWFYTLVFLAAVWQFHFWNLLGWQY